MSSYEQYKVHLPGDDNDTYYCCHTEDEAKDLCRDKSLRLNKWWPQIKDKPFRIIGPETIEFMFL